ncbi:hypothetical protein Bca4012_051257 [Brassica carinata]
MHASTASVSQAGGCSSSVILSESMSRSLLLNVNPSILIFFEIKSFNAGQITAESFSLENHQFQRGRQILFSQMHKSDKSTPNFLRLWKLSELEGFMPVRQQKCFKVQMYLAPTSYGFLWTSGVLSVGFQGDGGVAVVVPVCRASRLNISDL